MEVSPAPANAARTGSGRSRRTRLPGEPGASHVGWKVDTRAYAAIPVMSDGSEGAPLVLRDLFEQFLSETR
jgi:hypothetical protein